MLEVEEKETRGCMRGGTYGARRAGLVEDATDAAAVNKGVLSICELRAGVEEERGWDVAAAGD